MRLGPQDTRSPSGGGGSAPAPASLNPRAGTEQTVLFSTTTVEEDEGAVDEDENADEGIWQLTDGIEIIEDEMGGGGVNVTVAALLGLANWEEVETEVECE